MTPNPPSHLPKKIQDQWTKTYSEALQAAKRDNPELPSDAHTRTALVAANKLVKVDEPANHAEAQKLVDAFKSGTEDSWKIIAHGTRKVQGVDHLVVVTANGKKSLHPIPKPKA